MTTQTQSPATKPHILVIDDDDRLRSLLRRYLAEQGFVVSTASSAEDARAKLKSLGYDLLVLDIMMPGETGLELTASLRAKGTARQTPILLLTARGESSDRIEGLEVGADDYMSKPFEPRELVLRINSILRRAAKPKANSVELKLGKWTYNPARDELYSDAEIIKLTGMEAGLLRELAAEPGTPLSREILVERSAASGAAVSDRTIDVQVTRLRKKIEADAKNPRYLVTVRGEGYMLMPDVENG